MLRTRRSLLIALAGLGGGVMLAGSPALAASARTINAEADQALRTLCSTQPEARELSRQAKAVLIFPGIIKAGLIIGGQSGDGVLRVGGKPAGYYNISAASFGLRARI